MWLFRRLKRRKYNNLKKLLKNTTFDFSKNYCCKPVREKAKDFEDRITELEKGGGGGGGTVYSFVYGNTSHTSSLPLRDLTIQNGDVIEYYDNLAVRDVHIGESVTFKKRKPIIKKLGKVRNSDNRNVDFEMNDGYTTKTILQGHEDYYFNTTLTSASAFSGVISDKEFTRIINNDAFMYYLIITDSQSRDYVVRMGSAVYDPVGNAIHFVFFDKLGGSSLQRWEVLVSGIIDTEGNHAITGTGTAV